MLSRHLLPPRTNELLGILRKLVSIRTVNPPGACYSEITALLRAELEARGLKTKLLRPPMSLQKSLGPEVAANPRANVLGKLKVPGAKRTLHFNAHFDVVPVSGRWRHGDAFSGQVEKGWIYGRGTSDMKGSIASLLTALDLVRASGRRPSVNLEVSFTADEETDSLLGAGWLVKNAAISPDYALVMEGGQGRQICCGHNGVCWLRVEVKGKAAHGSRPDMGINALEKMSALVLSLEAHKTVLSQRVFTTPEGRQMRPTINVGGIFDQGEGGKINTVPALASFSIDRRVLPNEKTAKAEAELRHFLKQAAARIPDCRISISKVSESHPSLSLPDHTFAPALAKCVAEVRRQEPRFVVSSGFTDMQFFSHELGIPTLGYGPGGRNEHAVDESARVSDLLGSAAIYANLMLTL